MSISIEFQKYDSSKSEITNSYNTKNETVTELNSKSAAESEKVIIELN